MADVVKVLSIDGGGIRGLIPATVLSAIEERTKARTADLFDLIAGTSTGGILALGLVKPSPRSRRKPQYSAAELAELYEQEGDGSSPARSGTDSSRSTTCWMRSTTPPGSTGCSRSTSATCR